MKLSKFLKPFILTIAFILGLLFIQSQTDLALPDYMSQIVDKGIASSGIESVAPDALRATTYDKLMLFVAQEDKELIAQSFDLVSPSSNSAVNVIKDYPLVSSESVYVRNSFGDEHSNELNNIFTRPFLIVSGITEMSKKPDAKHPLFANLPAGMDPFDAIPMMTIEQRAQMQEAILDTFSNMPEATMKAAARISVKQEYEALGVNMSKYQQRYILSIGAIMLFIAAIGSIASITVSFLSSRVAAGFSRNVRQAVFEKVISFSSSEFNSFSTASLITRTTNDIQLIQQILTMALRILFYAPILGIGAVLRVMQTNVSMTWVIGLAVAVILIIIGIAFVVAFPKFQKIQTLVDRLNLVMRESLTGMLVIRAFNTQKQEENKFRQANKDMTDTNLFVNRVMSILMPAMMFIMNSVSLLIVWVGAQQVDIGTLQVGEMMAFLQYAMQIIMSFLMITMISIMLPRAQVAANRVAEVLDTPLSLKDSETPVHTDNTQGDIVFDHVSFRYPGAEEDVLRDISFVAKPGEVTAFIGSTGSGKSTIINLIPRFFDITSGRLTINGNDIRSYRQHDLREMIGFVPQKGILFSGTIGSNIAYGKQDATQEEITEAASIAQAMEFIEHKELGFDDPISQGGTNVSGGQKQRLSIARALVKKAPIYIFDDTFSALDFKTESVLRKQLEKLISQTKSTVFIVAQRINTIMNADQIIVLDRGKIVGIGKHSELLNTCQVYQEIAYSQLSKEELSHE